MRTSTEILEAVISSDFRREGVYCAAAIGKTAQYVDDAQHQITSVSPIDGQSIAVVGMADPGMSNRAISLASAVFTRWRTVPAPRRGELVAMIGEIVRERKELLAQLITLEMGKIHTEALGEVQEWIDMCDFAVGLSRQLYGLTISTERPQHRMMEQWHPLGPVGVISAFNFPMAVWAWNAMLAFVCGDTVVWKPSEKTLLCALACHQVVVDALERLGDDWGQFSEGLSTLVMGAADVGHRLALDKRLPLVSATGSVTMGKKVATVVGARLGRSLLELGGNNAAILAPSADMGLAVPGIVFSAVGTCGQRCTSLRRLIVHVSLSDKVTAAIKSAFEQVRIGDPRDEATLMGPLIDETAFEDMQNALSAAKREGGVVLCGGERVSGKGPFDAGYYVKPALIKIEAGASVVKEETFAPILYLHEYKELDEALAYQNDVSQGLSSTIFTNDVREAELFLSASGSDCGIANVNIGTSGAEIGGAFGGEKETGGGRESGSDAWKNYMRRATNTINYGSDLPLAQGVKFDL